MKDHEIAQLVNALRDCAVEFRDAQQLRERIAALVVPALRGARTPDTYLADAVVRYMTEIGRANKGIRRLRRKLDKALEDIDDLSGACSIAWAAAAKAEPLRAPTPQDCVDIAEWHKSECEACCINPSESEDYGRAMVDAVRLVLVDGPNAALQQSSSGITAGAEKPPQVVDFGAAGPNRTGDLLITNQSAKAPETSQNQDVTPKTAPTQPVEVVPAESSGCEGVTAGEARAEYIEVCADVRYWEDASVNGTDDDNGTLIPFRNGDAWCPVIRLADGMVMDWPQGMTAHIHYKVCDAGEYWLLDSGRQRTAKWGGYYVPNDFLCHGDSGYGDYIIFKVGADGVIANWCSPAVEMARGGDEESHHKWVALIKDGTP